MLGAACPSLMCSTPECLSFMVLMGMTSGALSRMRPCPDTVFETLELHHCCRHPLDQQNTRVLKVLPGLEGMAKNVLGKAS